MNIGILQCDRVLEKFSIQHGQYPDMFMTLLKQVDPALTFTVYDLEQAHLPPHVDACDAYLITGSRHGVNDPLPWIAQLEDFIRQLHAKQKKNHWDLFRPSINRQSAGRPRQQIT